jgi:hypothetical protein
MSTNPFETPPATELDSASSAAFESDFTVSEVGDNPSEDGDWTGSLSHSQDLPTVDEGEQTFVLVSPVGSPLPPSPSALPTLLAENSPQVSTPTSPQLPSLRDLTLEELGIDDTVTPRPSARGVQRAPLPFNQAPFRSGSSPSRSPSARWRRPLVRRIMPDALKPITISQTHKRSGSTRPATFWEYLYA